MPPREKLYTSFEAATLLQVSPTSIWKWTESGILRVYRTPGGHLRIAKGDLVTFARAQGMFVPAELEGGRTTVLFVDADAHVLGAMRRAMTTFGDRVDFTTSQSGTEALVRLGSKRPDVLVIDVALPGLSGRDVIKRLKENDETKTVEIVVMTDNLSPAVEASLLTLGAKAVRAKPISAEELVDLVTRRER